MGDDTIDDFELFCTRIRATAHRRRVTDARLFGPARRATVSASVLPPELCAELDALAEESRRGRGVSHSRPATPEAKRQMSATARNRTETVTTEPAPEPKNRLTPDQIAEVEQLRRESASYWTWKRLGERYGVSGHQVKLDVLGLERHDRKWERQRAREG
jgi:hypothetical protein